MKTPIICQLSDFGPEYPGSFVDSLLCLAHHCRQTLGLETLCVFAERAKERKWLRRFDSERVRYAFVPARRNSLWPLARVLRSYEPLIIHCHFETFDLSGFLIKGLLHRNAKIILHGHSVAELTWRQRLKDLIKIKCFARRLGDLFMPVGDGAYRNAIDRGFPADRVMLNHNGIDIDRFSRGGRSRQKGRSGHELVFLALGRVPYVKGVDVLVKAVAELAPERSEQLLFLIVGGEETGQFVRRLPESAGLTRLRIIGPAGDFTELLSSIDVFVASSRSEGFGFAVVEAMAAEKLVLCSDIPGVRETYGKVAGVWLFPSQDWKRLAELMQKAMELSPAERQELGRVNSRYAAEHHSLHAWARRTVRSYERLLGSQRSRLPMSGAGW